MNIDELGEHRMRNKTESDHNTIIAEIQIKKIQKEGVTSVTNWNLKAPEEKWEKYREELWKSVEKAKMIMEDTSMNMTERYTKWEKLIYNAAMKTIGKTTTKCKKVSKPSAELREARKARAESKKEFET